ncbi:flavodoxin domain-containing protein [Saccharothrix mutabilis subsp. mutabilis]|uniref:Flavodoxin domain-containing protein n=1 Tax=Saccharothrix mutabilis subsp. mutabilis TaxID=66855 RepID=A0ABN0UUW5_9PSEU
MTRVLVAYATAEGSTRGVARRVGTVLARHGHDVVVREVADVTGLDGFDAVVLGSAVHDEAWLDEATAFVATHRAELARVPVWAFSVGMPDALPGVFARAVRAEGAVLLDDLRAHVTPLSHRLFSGVTRPRQYPWPRRLLFRLAGGRFGDHRDWPAIDRWAREIHRALSKAPRSTA